MIELERLIDVMIGGRISIHPGTATRQEIDTLIEEFDKFRAVLVEQCGRDLPELTIGVRWDDPFGGFTRGVPFVEGRNGQ